MVARAAAQAAFIAAASMVALAPMELLSAGGRSALGRLWAKSAPSALPLLFTGALLASAASEVPALSAAGLAARASSSVARWAAFVLLLELGAYWLHRAEHRFALLWRVHRLHHEPRELCWWDAWRQHPVDQLLHVAVAAAAISLAPVPLAEAAPVLMARKLYTSVLHVHGAAPRDAWSRWVATPAFHHRHHREDEEPANFATSLAWLDVLFGTWAAARKVAHPLGAER